MIDFKEAEAAARNGFDDFVKGASNIVLEEIVISDDNSRYEVTFSYDVDRTLHRSQKLALDRRFMSWPLF